MSTLSELIPSGGTQNNIEFVAQGTLANGQTVALRSDGKVEAIAQTGAEAGTSYLYADVNVDYENPVCYDPDNNKIVYIWKQSGSYYSIGTVSGTAITFSTPVQWRTSSTFNITIVYNTEANGFAISYSDGGNNSYQTVIGASLSGSTLTFGTPVVFNSNGTGRYVSSVYASLNDKVLIAYKDDSNSGYGTCVSLTMANATTIQTVGSEAVFSSSNIVYPTLAWSPVSRKAVVAYSDYGQSGRGTARTISLNGNVISYGTAAVYSSVGGSEVAAGYNPIVYDSVNEQFLIGFQNATTSPYYAYFCSATISGTNLTFGTPNITSPTTGAGGFSGVFDVASGEALFFMYDNTNSNKGTMVSVGGTGNTLSIGTPTLFSSNATAWTGCTYDSTVNKVVATYSDSGDGVKGKTFLASAKGTNATSFVGITNAAISSGATGEVAVKGGLSTTADLGKFAASDVENQIFMTYDTTNNKVIVVYQDSIFKAVVGTVSGTGISFGSPVTLLNSGATSFALTFDVNAGKLVAIYGPSSNGYATAVIGTVSGTSISFGTPVVWASSSSGGFGIDYDAVAQKVLIAYHDGGSDAKAIVGTVSGTSISFGSAAVFVNYQSNDSVVSYDVTANKSLIIYQASTSGYGIVATISGTSVSFGSSTVITTGQGVASSLRIAYDSSLSKHGFLYKDDQGYHSRVATVSGTSVSFGAIAALNPQSGGALTLSITYDTSSGAMLYITSVTAGSSGIFTSVAKISGTDLIFPAGTQLSSGFAYQGIGSVYDPDSAKVVIGREDNSDNYHGYSQVITITGDPLAIGSNYFVQDDGSLATTSSTTKAGKAISTTALNLVDPT